MNDGHGGIDSSAGGPHRDGMEARVAVLEDRWSRIEGVLSRIEERTRAIESIDQRTKAVEERSKGLDDRLRRLEMEVAEVKGRVYSLPSTWAAITTVIGGQIAFSGLVFAVATKLIAK